MSKIMLNSPNLLRIHRKRSPLTQADIAYFIGSSDYSNISRYEKGQRSPTIEFLLVYHHLFNTSIEVFFEHHSNTVQSRLLEGINEYISKLIANPAVKNKAKVEFLDQVLKRLATRV